MIAIARWLLAALLPADARAAVLIELDAEYRRAIMPSRGAWAAAAWYWRQVAGLIGPAILMRGRRMLRLAAEAGQDLRFGARLLARQKAFTAATVATLALGIGANTAIFSVVDGVLLRPLPYREPSRLVRVWSANPRGLPRNGISPADYFDWREQARGFEGLAAFTGVDGTLTGAGDPVQLTGAAVTANLADLLGTTPLLGRWFVPEETRGTGQPVVILSEQLWRERFGGAPDIVGRSIVLDLRARTVVGVMPRAFAFPSADERMWLPIPDSWRARERDAHVLDAIGRLAPGVDIGAGRDALQVVARRIEEAYPVTSRGWGVTVVPLRDALVGSARTPLFVLLAAVASILLIACANVASLMLARGAARSRELAVRAALGASRSRLLRQQLVESALLSAIGGAAALMLASWCVQALKAFDAVPLPLLDRVVIDTRVLTAAAVLSLLAAVATGLLPAWHASRQRSADGLGAGARATGAHVRLRQAIVFAQIAVATAMVAGGLLFVRSLARLTAVQPGFEADRTMLADVSLPVARYAKDARAPFFDRALERIRALPGVQAAGAGGPLPLSGRDGFLRFGVVVDGRLPAPGSSDRAYVRWATEGYFAAMGIRQQAGRPFAGSDTAQSAPVAIVDEEFARRFFGGESPVGRRIALSLERTVKREIVGVVGSVRQMSLDRAADPHVYLPEPQLAASSLTLVVRATGDAATVAAGVRDVVAGLDRDLPPGNVRSLADLVAGSTASRRLNAVVLSAFAFIAVALTLVGVYGVVSQIVAQSTRELGVRIALGASGADVVSLTVRRAVMMAVAGVSTGSVAAWLAAPALGGMLYGIGPRDPGTLAGAALLLIAVTSLAAYAPARRILRIDVVHALRVD